MNSQSEKKFVQLEKLGLQVAVRLAYPPTSGSRGLTCMRLYGAASSVPRAFAHLTLRANEAEAGQSLSLKIDAQSDEGNMDAQVRVCKRSGDSVRVITVPMQIFVRCEEEVVTVRFVCRQGDEAVTFDCAEPLVETVEAVAA